MTRRVYTGKVPVAPLREAFLRSNVNASDVARGMGWWFTRSDGRTSADCNRVRRTLGVNNDISFKKGKRYVGRREMVDEEVVEQIAWVIGIGPWEVLPEEDVA